jgi:DNA topoisomerase-2
MHADQTTYMPELVFGLLDTLPNSIPASGLGLKLANIFSARFSVECLDSRRLKRFRMAWEDNMTKRHEPEVTDVTANRDYTEITFRPDLQRFGMATLDKDIVALLTKRVYDIAGCNPHVKVCLNKRRIQLDGGFEEYVGPT